MTGVRGASLLPRPVRCKYAVAYHVALISNPTVCSGSAASLSRRVALKPNDRSGAPCAGVHSQPRV